MPKLHDILELMRKLENPSDSENPADLQREIDIKVNQALAQASTRLVTRESLMQAIQIEYRKYLKKTESKSDAVRRTI